MNFSVIIMYYFIKIFATAETDTDQWVVSIIL